MAVYRCEVKTLNRAAGRSAVAAVAYRAAVRLHDDRADKGHDYRRKARGVAFTAILAPKGAPAWASERGALWNGAEAAENRKNSVTAREVLISLPHELDDQQRAELAAGFAGRLVERYGVAVDLAIHRPDRKGDNRNHHAHLMMTTRRLGPEGFGEKTRELDDIKKRGPEEIEAIRQLWEDEQNHALERAGLPERVTRLSLKAQGIEREPEPKIGPSANAIMRRGEPSRRGGLVLEVRKRNTMRQNMARQRTEKEEREKQEAISRALEAARRVQKAPEPIPTPSPSPQKTARPPASDQAATRAWEKQRQAELRRQRLARDQAAENIKDPGRVKKPPGLE